MSYDIAIIGAGPGGYSAALKAAKLGAKVVMIEKGDIGGVCLNKGCIPTKAILKSAQIFREIKKAHNYGILVDNPKIDILSVMERKIKVQTNLRTGLTMAIKQSGIDLIKSEARIIEENKILADDKEITSKKIIIASGSSPAKPPIPGINLKSVIFSDEALELKEIPESMIIIGGGVLGIEFASFFSTIGTKVTVLELQENIIPGFDTEIAAELYKLLTRAGVEIIRGAFVKEIKESEVLFEKDNVIESRQGKKILVSIGRIPNTKELFDESLGIKIEKGYIVTDEKMRTNVENIYAVGDINGKDMLAHTALAEGIVAAENICGRDSTMKYDAIPKCIYTSPEIACVGLTENEALNRGYAIKKSKILVRTNGRAHADGNIEGFIKIIAEESGKLLGVHIIAPYATEMISEATLALTKGLTYKELSQVIHPHPTVSELFGDALMGLE